MARQVRGWDALRAWRFIRACKAYRSAYAKRLPQPGLPERAPFPVRLQTAADMGAMRFGMMAWEDPWAPEPLAPFWVHAGVVDATVTFDTPPLVRLAAEGGTTLSGLRLGDGALMVRIEEPGRAVQIRFPGGCTVSEDSGLRLIRDVETIEDVWLGLPVPPPGPAQGTTGTASFCWRSNARRRGLRCGSSRSGSGAGSGSRRNTMSASGCTSASSAAGPVQGRS